jgi:hypothetical protein
LLHNEFPPKQLQQNIVASILNNLFTSMITKWYRVAGGNTQMTRQKNIRSIFIGLALVIGTSLFLYSCGGGGGGGTTAAGGSISGTAVKGPVNGATVTAYAINNGVMGAQIGSGTTDAQGNFSISVGTYSGSVMLQMNGGAYTDEATNTSMTMHAGDVMTAAIPSVASGATITGIQMTPLTSMAQARAHTMAGGMTEANIIAANTAVGTYFMVNDILHTSPMNPLVPGSGTGATSNMKNYGMAIAAMSQYAGTLGMPFSSGMITAMMDDATDGVMNGMMGSTPISMNGMGGGGMMMGNMQSTAGTSGLATAMTTFINNASVNKSGVSETDMNALITQLNTSTGQLQGAGGSSVSGMVSGTAVIGLMSSGTVKAFAITNGIMGAQLASGPTDTHGNFTVPIGAYSGPLMLQISGGVYTDMATGATMSMFTGDVMTSVIPLMSAGSTTSGIQITPLTSMAQARSHNMTGGMTEANINAANNAVGSYFMVSDILLTQPMDPAINGSGAAASQDMRNYGMTIAAISQEANTLGMPYSSGMVTAMMDDASDGVMNGMMGSTPISMTGMGGMMGGGMMGGNMQTTAGTSGLSTAMTAFINNALVNKSGLTTTDMIGLIQKLTTSSGSIQ